MMTGFSFLGLNYPFNVYLKFLFLTQNDEMLVLWSAPFIKSSIHSRYSQKNPLNKDNEFSQEPF